MMQDSLRRQMRCSGCGSGSITSTSDSDDSGNSGDGGDGGAETGTGCGGGAGGSGGTGSGNGVARGSVSKVLEVGTSSFSPSSHSAAVKYTFCLTLTDLLDDQYM